MTKKIHAIYRYGAAFLAALALSGCDQEDAQGKETEPAEENSQALCSDGEDNDDNGEVDCDDAKCAAFCENTEANCEDGEDNDGNGEVDCDDAKCEAFCEPPWEFDEWPEGTSPEEVGKRVAENFVPDSLGTTEIHYAQAATWYGALTFAELTDDQDLQDRLIARFDPFFTEEGAALIPSRAHVDDRVFGIVPLEIYLLNGDERYLDMGKGLADAQWETVGDDGITLEARYWIDDMYMITAIQVQAFRATEEPVYRDRTALTMVAYLEELQEESGLFFHTKASPVYWGRGNGWVASGMAEMLRSMSEEDDYYDEIMERYLAMMAALLEYQTDEGPWRQIVDDEEAWIEASGSAMFTFAMATGVKNGWLKGKTFGPAVQKAWIALVGYLKDNADLGYVCVGTGDAASQGITDPEEQRQYYLDRGTRAGDYHGQAPMLWTASALLRQSDAAK